ncbi:glycosyltransferase [Larkinella bovis]|uniref:Glycosyltransferase n=1 Tax=Larkinella bovis TaxID=683041 RepID=A0ABW0IGX1_9BACT
MHIVIFTHPEYSSSQSMPRFARMLSDGMKRLGHTVEFWSPKPTFYSLDAPPFCKKWLGYMDQFILFPWRVRKQLKRCSANTLFVFADQALGPWVPLVASRPHVIHCHDFLAQRSALGEISENPTSWTGKRYQAYIRQGYRQGRNFISISMKTQADLHQFLNTVPACSEVVYNGVNSIFKPGDSQRSRAILGEKIAVDLSGGYLLHVGGNDWYKNRKGVIRIYDAWRQQYRRNLPLVLIGPKPSDDSLQLVEKSVFKNDIHFLTDVDDQLLLHAYRGALLFLFPSLAEGFGWPIAEAMACGCRVLTTGEAPMTEVAGKAAAFISRMPQSEAGKPQWVTEGAQAIEKILAESAEQRQAFIDEGFETIKRYDSEKTTARIEKIYTTVLSQYVS